MPCYLLTDAERDAMIADGWTVVNGPFATEEECLDEPCSACVTLGITAFGTYLPPGYGELTFEAELTLAAAGEFTSMITGALDAEFDASLELEGDGYYSSFAMPATWQLTISGMTDNTCGACGMFNDDWNLGQVTPTIWATGDTWSCSTDAFDHLGFYLAQFGDALQLVLWDANVSFPFATYYNGDISGWNGTDPIVLTGGATGGDTRCNYPATVTITAV